MTDPGRYSAVSSHGSGRVDPPAYELSELQPAGSGTCVLCHSPDTLWQHDLDRRFSHWRDQYEYGMTWGSPLLLCDDCEVLWRQAEYWRLIRRQQASTDDTETGSDVDLLLALAAFCRSDRGVRRQPDPDPAG